MTDSLKNTITSLPHVPGVYIFRDAQKNPLYVGKSIDLRARVGSYFQQDISLPPKTKELVQHIVSVETIETDSELEALLLEAALVQSIAPRYNSALKDDKRYQYICVTESYYKRTTTSINVRSSGKTRKIYHPDKAYPAITTSRKADDPQAIYFGPFPDGKTVRHVLKLLRRVFGWCKYDSLDKAQNGKRPCFYYHIGQCPGFCAGKITHDQYLQHMDRIIQFLRGDRKELVKELTEAMNQASASLQFEEAARLRDQLERIEYITQSFRSPDAYFKNPSLEGEQYYFARQQLRDLLGEINTAWAPWLRNLERVEAYDISNTQGSEPTGSMVVLVNGEPRPNLYRMFKIRTIEGINDPAMMGEMMRRRLGYLGPDAKKQDESFTQLPQLLLIDGGKTQVNAVLRELKKFDMQIPVIGLAKQEEVLIVPVLAMHKYKMVRLPKDSPALHLMQKIRDEAHRFAKKFHVLLRKKRVTG